jgi:hypothetical protein
MTRQGRSGSRTVRARALVATLCLPGRKPGGRLVRVTAALTLRSQCGNRPGSPRGRRLVPTGRVRFDASGRAVLRRNRATTPPTQMLAIPLARAPARARPVRRHAPESAPGAAARSPACAQLRRGAALAPGYRACRAGHRRGAPCCATGSARPRPCSPAAPTGLGGQQGTSGLSCCAGSKSHRETGGAARSTEPPSDSGGKCQRSGEMSVLPGQDAPKLFCFRLQQAIASNLCRAAGARSRLLEVHRPAAVAVLCCCTRPLNYGLRISNLSL